MIYRDDRHQRTFEKELTLHPKTTNRKLLAALYLLTAMLMSEGKKLQEPFLSLICLAPN